MDILWEVYSKKLNENEAHSLYEQIQKEAHKKAVKLNQITYDLEGALGMDNYEYTAFCHGLPLKQLAKWRYKGWPSKTIDTNQDISYKEFYWTIKILNRRWGLVSLR